MLSDPFSTINPLSVPLVTMDALQQTNETAALPPWTTINPTTSRLLTMLDSAERQPPTAATSFATRNVNPLPPGYQDQFRTAMGLGPVKRGPIELSDNILIKNFFVERRKRKRSAPPAPKAPGLYKKPRSSEAKNRPTQNAEYSVSYHDGRVSIISSAIPDDDFSDDILNKLELALGLAKAGVLRPSRDVIGKMITAVTDIRSYHRLWFETKREGCPQVDHEPEDEFMDRLDAMMRGEKEFVMRHCKYGYMTPENRVPKELTYALNFAKFMLDKNPVPVRADNENRGPHHIIHNYAPADLEPGAVYTVDLIVEIPNMTAEFDRMADLLKYMLMYLERTHRRLGRSMAEISSIEGTAYNSTMKLKVEMWVSVKHQGYLAIQIDHKDGMTYNNRLALSAVCQRFFEDKPRTPIDEPPIRLEAGLLSVYATFPCEDCVPCRRYDDVLVKLHKLVCTSNCSRTCSYTYWTDLSKPCKRPDGDGNYDDVNWFISGSDTILRNLNMEMWLTNTVGLKERYVKAMIRNRLDGPTACFGYGKPTDFPGLHSERLADKHALAFKNISKKLVRIVTEYAHERLRNELTSLPFTDDYRAEIYFAAACGDEFNLRASNLNGDVVVKYENSRGRVSLFDGNGVVRYSAEMKEIPHNFNIIVAALKNAAQNYQVETNMTFSDAEENARDALSYVNATINEFVRQKQEEIANNQRPLDYGTSSNGTFNGNSINGTSFNGASINVEYGENYVQMVDQRYADKEYYEDQPFYDRSGV
ncbi:hypothetical protein [Cyprinid herpesvirus 2]|nr:hypothetical protein [Cyprinid herpesvirus 2]QIM55171.1 hypothetical protein [Cyprinid herpesvirus 2]